MKKHVLSLVLICTISLGFAQDSTLTKESKPVIKKHLIGLSAGSASGLGFSYRYVKNRWGIQATGIPIFNNSLQFASVGLAGTYRVHDPTINPNKTAFLLYAGTHFFTWKNGINNYESNINYALGFGFEHNISNRLELNMMAGYGLYTGNGFLTMISGEFGLHYKINGLKKND